MVKRCAWAEKESMHKYHDEEWGVPNHDDKKHFEFLILEGAQAGLSWETILKRRLGYKKAFSDFDVGKIAKYNEANTKYRSRYRLVRMDSTTAAATGMAQPKRMCHFWKLWIFFIK